MNGRELTAEQVAALEARYRIPLMAGRTWYDAKTGVFGFEGGPPIGKIDAGLDLGDMPPGCSGKGTFVFMNGRELHPIEVVMLVQVVPIAPGRYWLDVLGNVGLEGGPALFNLAAAVAPKLGAFWPGAGQV